MTKEKLYGLLLQESRYASSEDMHIVKKYLDKFFISNVCIPKGENRHPYADELHKLAEDQNSVEFKISEFTKFTNDTSILEFRVKPSEPVYEWQWCVILADGTGSIYGYHTEKDINEIFPKQNKFKMQNSQRERKQ